VNAVMNIPSSLRFYDRHSLVFVIQQMSILYHKHDYLLLNIGLNYVTTCFDQNFGPLQATTFHKKK
jgi:hypothetical protein